MTNLGNKIKWWWWNLKYGEKTAWCCPICNFKQVSITLVITYYSRAKKYVPNLKEYNPLMICSKCRCASKLSTCSFRGFPGKVKQTCVACETVKLEYTPKVEYTQHGLGHFISYGQEPPGEAVCPKCGLR